MNFFSLGKILWRHYETALQNYPKAVKCLTGGLLSGIGDFLTQIIIEGPEIDYKRTGVMSVYGVILTKLEVVWWYKFLDWFFGKQKNVKSSLLKTGTDMTIFAPFEIGFCISWVTYFEGKEKKIIEKLESDFKSILLASYLYRFPVGFFCFYAVPVKLRALYIGMASLGWDMYISFASHNPFNILSDNR